MNFRRWDSESLAGWLIEGAKEGAKLCRGFGTDMVGIRPSHEANTKMGSAYLHLALAWRWVGVLHMGVCVFRGPPRWWFVLLVFPENHQERVQQTHP